MKKYKIKKACTGYYGKTLDVKITNQCNKSCPYCIERDGYSPPPSREMHKKIKEIAKNYDNIHILGGEPLVYNGLFDFIYDADHPSIHITSNGLLLDQEMALRLAESGIKNFNISIDKYRYRLDFDAISILSKKGVNVRFNILLVKGEIDNLDKCKKWYKLARAVGATVKFTEIFNQDDSFVNAYKIFNIERNYNPYTEGCEVDITTLPGAYVKVLCGLIKEDRDFIGAIDIKHGGHFDVLYPNGEVTSRWLKSGNKKKGGRKMKDKITIELSYKQATQYLKYLLENEKENENEEEEDKPYKLILDD